MVVPSGARTSHRVNTSADFGSMRLARNTRSAMLVFRTSLRSAFGASARSTFSSFVMPWSRP